jgi:hypothetical protein
MKEGHQSGVRHLSYSDEHDTLISVGFDFEGIAWDVSSLQKLMFLKGHRAPLVHATIVQLNIQYCVTADESGVFKMWDIRRK